MTNTRKIFRDNLFYFLSKTGEQQSDICNLLDVSSSTVSSWFSADKMPRIEKIELLAEHYGVTVYIVSGAEPLTASQRDSRWIAFCQDHGLAHSELRVWHSHGVPHKHLTWICDIDRHQIRHDFATSLFRAGVPVKSVQHLLGHADYSTTMNIYVHWERQSLEDARSLMENFIAKEKASV